MSVKKDGSITTGMCRGSLFNSSSVLTDVQANNDPVYCNRFQSQHIESIKIYMENKAYHLCQIRATCYVPTPELRVPSHKQQHFCLMPKQNGIQPKNTQSNR